jgi:hypothetical protein
MIKSAGIFSIAWVCLAVFMAVPLSPQADPLIRAGSGATPAELQSLVEQFRIDLGGLNNGVGGGPFTDGFRDITWDAVPDASAAPNTMPGDFFNSTSRRGISFTTPGSGFLVSADASNPTSTGTRFSNVDPSYAGLFQAFSTERLFSPFGSTEMDIRFYLPATPSSAASVRGFGAVFADVDMFDSASLEFRDAENNILSTVFVPPSDGGLSFLGVSFTGNERIYSITLRAGTVPLGSGVLDGGINDLIVMDDFIFGEPTVVPEPSMAEMVGVAAGVLIVLLRFRNRR